MEEGLRVIAQHPLYNPLKALLIYPGHQLPPLQILQKAGLAFSAVSLGGKVSARLAFLLLQTLPPPQCTRPALFLLRPEFPLRLLLLAAAATQRKQARRCNRPQLQWRNRQCTTTPPHFLQRGESRLAPMVVSARRTSCLRKAPPLPSPFQLLLQQRRQRQQLSTPFKRE